MASSNVFGKAITDGSRETRAQQAYSDPNADGKRDQALAYVRRQKESYGNGVSTLSIFYNATGEELSYVQDYSFYGRIFDSFPNRVQNGQWGAFLHTKRPVVASGSCAYVVYLGRDSNSENCYQLLAWSVPWNQLTYNNQAYCDVLSAAALPDRNDVYNRLTASNRQHVARNRGMITTANIATGTSPVYEAILTLETVTRIFDKDQDHVEPISA